ncbi:MAG: LamG domain-containing protein, partial [Bacteroidota bacterium]
MKIIFDKMYRQNILIIVFLFFSVFVFPQADSAVRITFDFNEHEIKEKNNKLIPKAVGASLVKDRFGNEHSALYLHGNPDSYFVLGNSPYLKPKTGSISIWVNLDRIIYAGRGSEANPVIGAKNGPQDDFNCAYAIFLDYTTRRFGAASHKDSTREINIKSENEVVFNTWHHVVFTFDKSQFSFYVNGKLQQSAPKRHELNYLKDDSVMVGNSGSKKNYRWSQGVFDDIEIFHRALSPKEVLEL